MDWTLYNKDRQYLPFLVWIGGNQKKCAEDIVKVLNDKKYDEKGKEIQKKVMLDSKCGSGKSAIVLHVLKESGRAIIIVPSKVLQEQYRRDWGGKSDGSEEGGNYILKKDGTKLKIGTMLGRRNFACRFSNNNVDCDNWTLPCKRKLKKFESRYSVGSECPYFVGAPYNENIINQWKAADRLDEIKSTLSCDDIKYYNTFNNKKYGLFIRTDENNNLLTDNVCSYYKQFYNYLEDVCDVIIMNKDKWKLENWRKPAVDIECFDESDEFLNSLNESQDISRMTIDRMYNEKKEREETDKIVIETCNADNKYKNRIIQLTKEIEKTQNNEMQNDEMQNDEMQNDKNISSKYDELNSLHRLLDNNQKKRQIAIKDLLEIPTKKDDILNHYDAVVNTVKQNKSIIVNNDSGLIKKIKEFVEKVKKVNEERDNENDRLESILQKVEAINKYDKRYVLSTSSDSSVDNSIDNVKLCYNIPYPDLILKDMLAKSSKKILFCSATRHSEFTEKELFGLSYDAVIIGRRDQPGTLEILRPKFGMVRAEYGAMQDEEIYVLYHQILIYCVKALNNRGSTLVLTPGKNYVDHLMEYLKKENYNYVYDFSGKEESQTTGNSNTVTISTRMKRGVDLRDDMCRVIIWTKFPLKNKGDDYIKSLFLRFNDDNKTWKILNDMAIQDAIQGVCRGLRHERDTCTFATPDIKVFDCINSWWDEQQELKARKY
jgi:hypothetical protein